MNDLSLASYNKWTMDLKSKLDTQNYFTDVYKIASSSTSIMESLSNSFEKKSWVTEMTKIETLISSSSSFGLAYESVFNEFKLSESSLKEAVPQKFLSGIAIEAFNQAQLLALTFAKDPQKTTDIRQEKIRLIIGKKERNLDNLLYDLDPDLLEMLKGIRHAFDEQGPDWIRHFSISARELFTHVIHKLAPDESLRKWSKNSDDYVDNKPTRSARLRFICRHINHGKFKSFMEKDCEVFLEFIDLFQVGTHDKSPDLTLLQLLAMRTRMECFIQYLIEIGQSAG